MDIFEKLRKRVPVIPTASKYVFNDIYFGENGLTSTSANHVSAMANQFACDTKERMKSLRLHQKTIRVIGDQECVVEEVNDILSEIPQAIRDISKADALIAWFREAIKERETYQQDIQGYTLERWAEKFGETLPVKPIQPLQPTINFEDKATVLDAGLTVKEYNRFMELCSTLAVYGEFIHNNGLLAKTMLDLQRMRKNPTEVKENGRDTMIIQYDANTSEGIQRAVNLKNLYNQLQDEYRKLQAEKNGIQAKFEKMAVQYQLKMKAEYESAYAQWVSDNERYNGERKQFEARMQEWKQKECERIASLKIIIPNDLLDIYQKIISHQI